MVERKFWQRSTRGTYSERQKMYETETNLICMCEYFRKQTLLSFCGLVIQFILLQLICCCPLNLVACFGNYVISLHLFHSFLTFVSQFLYSFHHSHVLNSHSLLPLTSFSICFSHTTSLHLWLLYFVFCIYWWFTFPVLLLLFHPLLTFPFFLHHDL